ncbi:uncharacterized protein LOC124646105 [Helicoverpa zea]|uniref:uncharacterized protein LOC124646105 n=1 Tax=Helicoverpa zea TaxID=7113 RepID=UPI001F56CC7E|nr:uncharacterized protein LOC124646105 [Helicoverpa zea]
MFHCDCLAIDPPSDPSMWICSSCKPQTPGAKNVDNAQVYFKSNVTIRPNKRQALQSPPNIGSSPVAEERVRSIIEEVMQSQLDRLLEKMNLNMKMLLNQEINSMREEITGLRKSVDFMSNQYDDMAKEKKGIEDQVKALQSRNNELSATIKNMTSRINTLEQHARSKNVEIQCVPQTKNENLIDIIKQLGTSINCDIKEENILNCTRVMKANNNSERPKSIVVQFNTPRFRDTFLASVINFNKSKPVGDKLNATHVGLKGVKSPIFVSEHLSLSSKALHAATRIKAKNKGYKYVWIRGGRIFVRKADDSDIKVIKDMDSLDLIV